VPHAVVDLSQKEKDSGVVKDVDLSTLSSVSKIETVLERTEF